MPVTNYKDLKVWQSSIDFAKLIYVLTEKFPEYEKFGLTSQINRAAISIPSNIAEGHARDSRKKFLRFLSYSTGSLAEVETQLILAKELQFISENELNSVTLKSDEIGKMLRGLQKYIQNELLPKN